MTLLKEMSGPQPQQLRPRRGRSPGAEGQTACELATEDEPRNFREVELGGGLEFGQEPLNCFFKNPAGREPGLPADSHFEERARNLR